MKIITHLMRVEADMKLNRNKRLEIKTDIILYNKTIKESKESKMKLEEYLRHLFLKKLIIINYDFKNLEVYITYINELGTKINYITTSSNLKKDIINLKAVNDYLYKIQKYLHYILDTELIKLDSNIFNFYEKENTNKNKTLRFRVNDEEYQELKDKKNKLDFNTSNEFFNSILKNNIFLNINKDILMKLLFELQKVKNNLFQLKKYNPNFNIKDFIRLYKETEKRVDEYFNL